MTGPGADWTWTPADIVITRWDRGEHAPPPPRHPGCHLASDIAWVALSTDPDVREVVIRDCDPGVGQGTMIATGGTPGIIEDALVELLPPGFQLHIDYRPDTEAT